MGLEQFHLTISTTSLPKTQLNADAFLAGKPSNTFLKAIEKVLDGFVKNGGVWH